MLEFSTSLIVLFFTLGFLWAVWRNARNKCLLRYFTSRKGILDTGLIIIMGIALFHENRVEGQTAILACSMLIVGYAIFTLKDSSS